MPVQGSIPVVVPESVHPARDTRLVTIRCPWCDRKHTHGWPYGETEIGHRVAHCHNRARSTGYYIETRNES